MDAEQLAQLALEAEQELRTKIKEQMIREMAQDVTWSARQEMNKVINDWMKTNLVPELQAWLAENKDGIIRTAITVASTAGDTLAQAMIAEMQDKLKQSYTRKQIMEALFK